MRNIPLFKVFMADTAAEATGEVLKSGYIGQGAKVDEFEKLLSGHLQTPYVNTINSGTSGLHLILHMIKDEQISSSEIRDEVLTTPLTCLYGESPVQLPNGKTMSIKKMVDSKYSGLVLSFNEKTGRTETKNVIGWYKVPRNNKKWIRMTWRSAPNSREKISGMRGVWVTDDHPVLTDQGYKFAGEIAKGGAKLILNERQLNEAQKQFVLGTLLGDGFLRCSQRIGSNRFRFCVCHSAKQSDWIELKKEILSEFGGSFTERPAYKQSGPRVDLTLPFSSIWNDWNDRFYNPTKSVPSDLKSSELTDMALATWFMDDGSRNGECIVLCTESFSKSDVRRLIKLLGELGIVATPQNHKGNGYRIYIGSGQKYADSANKFFKKVSPYVVPSLRHKIPSRISCDERYKYNKELWNISETIPFVDCAGYVVDSSPNVKKHKTDYVYCIDVEDNHNFISGDIILHNCTATNFPILAHGLKIKWVDLDPNTCNVDMQDLRRKIGPKTLAIMVVHWGGYPCDLAELESIQKQCHSMYGFVPPVIEDCAHAFGAKYHGKPLGSHNNYCMFSFQAIKHLTTGDGGLITCPTDQAHKRAKLLRWYGLDRTSSADFRCEQNIQEWGYKFHMNDIAATIGIENFKHIDWILSKHRENATFLRNSLMFFNGVQCLESKDDRTSSDWVFTIRVDRRDEFMKMMKDKGIGVSRVHDRNDKHECLKDFRCPLPTTDLVCGDMTCIPCGWWMTPEDLDYVVDSIKGGW